MSVVLLVEDNLNILEVTAYMLEDAGYEVLGADGSANALNIAAERQDIAIVLSDLNLKSGSNGIDMGITMRERGLHCPMILISGDAEPPAGRLQPWMSYLAKPFDRQTLLDRMSAQLGNTSVA